jgi:hypothetical protein
MPPHRSTSMRLMEALGNRVQVGAHRAGLPRRRDVPTYVDGALGACHLIEHPAPCRPDAHSEAGST